MKIDYRLLPTGSVIPSEGYSDQVYVGILDDGTWLAVMTTGSGEEGASGQHITAVRSRDHGKTWEAPVDVEPANGPEASYAVLLKTAYGRVYAFYNYNADRVPEVLREDGGSYTRVDCVGHYVFKYSDDGGLTWSRERYEVPIRPFAVDRNNIYQGRLRFFWNVGRPFFGRDGKAYLPHIKVGAMGQGFYAQSEGALLCSANIALEKDPSQIIFETLPEGETGLRTPAGGGRISEEQSCVELSDGTLYCVYRSVDGYPVCTYSRDAGKTWAPPAYKTYAPEGQRRMKHPRAANFVWKCANGRYLYWFHNHGGSAAARGEKEWHEYSRCYCNRNPAWLAAGREIETPDGLKLAWSEPEILLYDDDPSIRMSYPDLIEVSGEFYVTETQKAIARVHHIEGKLIEGLFRQHELCEIAQADLLLDQTAGAMPSVIGFPSLPEFFDINRFDPAPPEEKQSRAGFTLELILHAGTRPSLLLDTLSSRNLGVQIREEAGGRLSLLLNDGQTAATWISQAGVLGEGGAATHAVLIVDGGCHIIRAVVNGVLLDGGEERQFGWGRFSPFLAHANGLPEARIDTERLAGLRVYGRALSTSEAVGNWRCWH